MLPVNRNSSTNVARAIRQNRYRKSVADGGAGVDERGGRTADFDLLVDDLRADGVYDLLRGIRLGGC